MNMTIDAVITVGSAIVSILGLLLKVLPIVVGWL